MHRSPARKLGMASLIALCTALLKKSVRGGLIIVGEINLGGSIEPIHNPVTIAEIAVEKGASALLVPVACRRQLFDLSDDMATKIDIQFFFRCQGCPSKGNGGVMTMNVGKAAIQLLKKADKRKI